MPQLSSENCGKVAPPRLELSQTEPKSGVLPLHHGANKFLILRAQRYEIFLTLPNFFEDFFIFQSIFTHFRLEIWQYGTNRISL